MQIGKAVALAAGIGLLGGCALLKGYIPIDPPVPCTGNSCPVSVAITYQKSPFKCDIDVKPESLDVSTGPSPKTITWTFTINGASPSLKEQPIKFGSNAQGVISNLTLSGSTVTGTYTRPPAGGNRYRYGVFVSLLEGLCSLDPWVVD